jgi:pimeloyl-ACP methyl ester carboxylesterase
VAERGFGVSLPGETDEQEIQMSTEQEEKAAWRDPALGEARTLELPGGSIRYHDVGSGPPIVFVHGLLVNANLWRKPVGLLAPDFRCIVLDMPLGSHLLPLEPDAANDPEAAAGLIGDALEALDLDQVTLVGNDSGGALSQVLITTRPERVGRLVLTSCDFRDTFPPKMFAYFKPAAAVPGLLWLTLQPLRLRLPRRLPIAFGWLAKNPIDRRAEDSYLLPALSDSGVRRDVRKFIKGIDTATTNAAADRLGRFERPSMIAWSGDDRLFPRSDAEGLVRELPDARLELIEDAYTFSPEDNPARLAELIREFVREPA